MMMNIDDDVAFWNSTIIIIVCACSLRRVQPRRRGQVRQFTHAHVFALNLRLQPRSHARFLLVNER